MGARRNHHHRKPKPECYVALEIRNPGLQSSFEAFQNRIVARAPKWKEALVLDFHITLALVRGDEDDLVRKFQMAQAAFDDIEAEVRFAADIGRFDDRQKNPKVVFAKVLEPATLVALNDRLKVIFGDASCDTAFAPHATLLKASKLRSLQDSDVRSLALVLEDAPKLEEEGSQAIDRLALMTIGDHRILATLEKRRHRFVDANGDLVTSLPLPKRRHRVKTPLTARNFEEPPAVPPAVVTPPWTPSSDDPKVTLFCYGSLMDKKPGVTAKLNNWRLSFDAPGAKVNANPGNGYIRGICYDDVLPTLENYAPITVDVHRDDGMNGPVFLLVARDLLNVGNLSAANTMPKPLRSDIDKLQRCAKKFFPFDTAYLRFLDDIPTVSSALDNDFTGITSRPNPLLHDPPLLDLPPSPSQKKETNPRSRRRRRGAGRVQSGSVSQL